MNLDKNIPASPFTHDPSEMLIDKEDQMLCAPQPQHNRTFHFAGLELQRFSFTHRAAYFRIARGDVSRLEGAYLLLFVLNKTAKQIDAVREPDEISAFRVAAGEWAETNMRTVAQRDEAFRVTDAIWQDIADAENTEPVPEKGGQSPKE